jgi:hypothetical protein
MDARLDSEGCSAEGILSVNRKYPITTQAQQSREKALVRPQRTTKDSMKLSRLVRCDNASSINRCPGKGLNETHATLSWKANSSEINSPTENTLTCHPSPRAREARKLLAASLEQNRGSTPSPHRKKV